MRLIHSSVLSLYLAVAAGLCVIGCGGVVDREDEPLPQRGKTKQGSTSVGGPKKREYVAVDPKDFKGVLEGKILWKGDSDFGKYTDALVEQMKGNTDTGYCLSGSEHEKIQQKFRVGKNGNLGNVFVWIEPAETGKAFNVPDSQLPANKFVVISQPHCAFLPHCVGVFAGRYKDGKFDPEGCQKFVVQNDATVPHNAQITGTFITSNKLLGKWDKTDKSSKPAQEIFELQPDKKPIDLRCSIHRWMNAFVRAYEHPYFAVSSVGADMKDAAKPVWQNMDSAEVGNFKLTGLPIGAKVKLFAWHEELGDLLGPNGEEITITAEKMTKDIPASTK